MVKAIYRLSQDLGVGEQTVQNRKPVAYNISSNLLVVSFAMADSQTCYHTSSNNKLASRSSRGGRGVEPLLHKRHDSAQVDWIPLGACIWYRNGPTLYVIGLWYVHTLLKIILYVSFSGKLVAWTPTEQEVQPNSINKEKYHTQPNRTN